MQSQKFLANYKCECYRKNYCNCTKKDVSSSVFLENIYDIAETLAEVMIICGIHQCKAKAAIDVIIYSFLHYDEIRHRIDAVPRKRLCKEDLIHDLGRKCLMNRMEAQLTYSIIKRAFKAFYHGTSEGGIRNPVMEAQLIHSQECLWVHAAKRTAQIFASYEGMFFSAQKNYECQIRCIYKRLYDRLHSRADPVEMEECECKGCVKRYVFNSPKPTKSISSEHFQNKDDHTNNHINNVPDTVLQLHSTKILPKPCDALCLEESMHPEKTEEPERHESKMSINIPRCFKCNCPQLICDCGVDRNTGILSTDCSQGPYKCHWFRMDEEDQADPCIEIPEDHQCPVDCDEASMTCDIECECNCLENCECPAEDSSDYEEDDDEIMEGIETREKEEEEEIDDTACSQYNMTDVSEREPSPIYDGCRMGAVNHVVEEESESPASIAKVEYHKNEFSVKSEQLHSNLEPSEAET